MDEPIQKINGRWPFTEVLGFTEIASSAFCFFTAVTHLYLLNKYTSLVESFSHHARRRYPFHGLWKFNSIQWFFVMMFSVIFHRNDTKLTERLDYFGAIFALVYMFYVCIVRTFKLTSTRARAGLAAALGVGYLYHISYMAFVLFDYGYNMKVGLSVGVAHTILWLVWGIRMRNRPYIRKLHLIQVLTFLFVQLEIQDFPPIWGIFDAHSLWHASGWILAVLWQDFVITDAEWVMIHGDDDVASLPQASGRPKQT